MACKVSATLDADIAGKNPQTLYMKSITQVWLQDQLVFPFGGSVLLCVLSLTSILQVKRQWFLSSRVDNQFDRCGNEESFLF